MARLAVSMVPLDMAKAGTMKPGDAVIWGSAASSVLMTRMRDMGTEPRYQVVFIHPNKSSKVFQQPTEGNRHENADDHYGRPGSW